MISPEEKGHEYHVIRTNGCAGGAIVAWQGRFYPAGQVQRHFAKHQILWATQYRKIRLLGKGGQGVVYLSERQGSDLFRLPVALKIFSPEQYRDAAAYEEDMARVAEIASRVALIQNDNLLDLHNFISNEGIRIMIMEWIDGFDLRDLLTQRLYDRSKESLSPERWKYVNKVILAPGVTQPRFKPGVAIQILRECLAGLGALHREGIAHGDLKPANIMVKRTGNAKIIDIGSAIEHGQILQPAHVVANLCGS